MKVKVVLICIICVISCLFLIGCNGEQLSPEIKTIMNEVQVEKEQANLIFEQLKNIGVDKFYEFKHDSMLDSWDYNAQTGYRMKGDGFSNLILYLDGNKQIDVVRYAGIDIYKENQLLVNFEELILDSEEKTFLKTQSELEIKDYLTIPNSADFPWYDWEYSYLSCLAEGSNLNDVNMAEISSYVEAKNSFGVKVRHNFTMVYCNSTNTNTWTKIYLSIDNQVYYNFIDNYLKHEHQYTTLKKSTTEHWWECSCGDKKDVEKHKSGAEATETTAQTCIICNHVITSALGHIHILHLTKVPAQPQSYTEEGNIEYYTCACGKWFTDNTATQEITDKSSVIIEKDEHQHIETNYSDFKVWVNITGNKFHFDQSCAGRAATGTTYYLALNMEKEPCDKCSIYLDEEIVYTKDFALEYVVNNLALSYNENWANLTLPEFSNVVDCNIDHLNKIVMVNYKITIGSDNRNDFDNGDYDNIIDSAMLSVDDFFEINIADMYGDGVLVGIAVSYIYE